MSEAVTDIIAARARQSDGLTTMVVWSIAVHAVAVAGMLLLPQSHVDEAPRTVMTISLGGAPGPTTDGMNQMGDRAVQTLTEKPSPIAPPPSPVQPKMTLPTERPRRRPERPRPEQAPQESSARELSTGTEVREGTTRTDTRTRGLGFGQATGGGFGGSIEVDVVDFCCDEYLAEVRDGIQRNYQPKQDFVGVTKMMFTIQKDGLMTDIKVERGSGYTKLDQASLRALYLTQRVPPLPSAYTNSTLTVHLYFEYRR